MADQFVLQPKLFLLQARQQVHVRVRAVLFGVDNCVKSGMFGCDCLGMGLVHRSISFRWLTRDNLVNKSRNEAFVARQSARLGGPETQLGVDRTPVTAGRASCKTGA